MKIKFLSLFLASVLIAPAVFAYNGLDKESCPKLCFTGGVDFFKCMENCHQSRV